MKRVLQIAMAVSLAALWSSVARGQEYFEDTFTRDTLDVRWLQDKSPLNVEPEITGNGDIVLSGGVAWAAPTYANCYNHIETPIDAGGNFVVQADVRVNQGNTWGGLAAVYWSETTYVAARAPSGGKLFTQVSDPDGYNATFTTKDYGGWAFVRMRIEFQSEVIQFYFQILGVDAELIHYPALDIPRDAAFQQSSALLIIGKGHQSPDLTEPDFDNDYSDPGAADEGLGIDNVLYRPLVDLDNPVEFFVDDFSEEMLDPRWSNDVSPNNANEPNFPTAGVISVSGGVAAAYPIYQNCYDHLETDIDASGEFAVQGSVRINHGQSWGALVSVYWDSSHFVTLRAGINGYFMSQVYDGSTHGYTSTMKNYTGWDYASFRLEFLENAIQFYAKSSSAEPEFTHLSQLDIPRGEFRSGQLARLIVGKGYMNDSGYPNQDYDNDYFDPGVDTEYVGIDNVIYENLAPHCGDANTVYLPEDLNHDCYVNAEDAAELSTEWLWCTDPENVNCDQYWLFDDEFTYTGDPTPLHPRWTSENSPGNPVGTDLTIVNWGDGLAQSGAPLDNLYNHLQTPIYANGNFEVECNMRGNNPSSWAPSLMVYWDATHWIRFAQFGNFGLMYKDGTTEHNVASSVLCGGWSFFTQRIEFTNTLIKFYGGVGPNPGEPPIAPVHIPAFDLPRAAWTKEPGALLIVGKGYQGWGYNNPDFDNDYVDPGAPDYLGIDRVRYGFVGSPTCTEIGMGILGADLNEDCYVDLRDFADLAAQWLGCTDPANAECAGI